MKKIINLKRDKDGFLVGEVSDLDEYLPFSLHDSQDDSMTEIADADDLLDWSSDIDTKPKYDYIIAQDVAFDEVCNNYRDIFANWDELTFAEKRDKINDFRCGN